jgi:glycosyltransferase involved in cell wall biosynthesis
LASRMVLPALERRLLRRARMLLPWSAGDALVALPADAAPAVVVPPPVEPSGPTAAERESLAVAYVPDPKAKGLDVVCAGWAAGGPEATRLEIYGIDPDRARSFLSRRRVALPPGADLRGSVPAADFRAALRRARVLVAGSRWEDFGLAPLEALADGALLATTPAGGPYPALAIARRLAPDLVAAEVDGAALSAAIAAAFALPDAEVARYRSAAHDALAPYEHESIVRTLRERVLPVLLPT